MVFGNSGQTKFKYGSTEIIIPNNVPLSFEDVIKERRLEDNATGEIFVQRVNKRLIYKCQSYIGEEKKFITEFHRLYQYDGYQVYCAPFSEGEYLQDSDGNLVLCDLSISWSHLKTRNYFDVLNFSFETLKGVDLTKLALGENVRVDPVTGMIRIDPVTGLARYSI